MRAVIRSRAIKMVAFGIAAAMLSAPAVARIVGVIEGTFYVRCPDGHDDKIEDLTVNHRCESCGKKSVEGGRAIVVCPDGHGGDENKVEGATRQHLCLTPLPGGGICGKQARR